MIPHMKNTRVPAPAVLLAVLCLAGCGTKVTVEPNRMGAQQGCAYESANLAQYNDCAEQVDAFYRDYEEHQQLSEKDDGK